MMACESKWISMYKEFVRVRLQPDGQISIPVPLKKFNLKTFKSANKFRRMKVYDKAVVYSPDVL